MGLPSYESSLAKLTSEIQRLNHHLDSRVSALENQLESGIWSAEGKQELLRINAAISDTVAKAREVQVQQKEAMLQAQRPPLLGYQGPVFGAWKAPETKALEKWFRAGGDAGALTRDDRALIDFRMMDYDRFSPETKTLVSAAADLGGFFAGTDLSDKFVQKLFLVSQLRQYADTQTIGGEKLLIPSEGSADTNIFWSDEQSGFQASPDPNLGMIEIFARELNGYLKLSKQNLEDSVDTIAEDKNAVSVEPWKQAIPREPARGAVTTTRIAA